jgi:Cu(I)/Ag(I) efflux system membrane fusion protein
MKNLLQNKYLIIAATLVVGGLIGWLIKPSTSAPVASVEIHDHASENVVYTCSMHPQIRQNEPGSCPLCGMALIPVESSSNDVDPMAIIMSPRAMQLANVVTQVVGTDNATKSIRLNGKVMEDERQVFAQSSHIAGRVETLAVNFTGEYVKRGQVIASIYSPELVTAQQELLEAQRIKETQPELFAAAKKKLMNWKLSENQINQVLSNGQPIHTISIRAEKSGYVKEKLVNLGEYIKQGAPIYQTVDLSSVWVMFDGYESDLQWIRKGAVINFTVASLPGETYSGKVSYIDPVINPNTRVSKIRVELANPKDLLKPEMFASGILQATSTSKGNQIIVPKTAVMWTGERSVVYVMTNTEAGVSFKARMVTLGASLGDRYVIKEGLEAGEELVVNGTFSVDAAAQLAGKPSMMSPEGGAAMTGHNHGGTTIAGEAKVESKRIPAVNISTKTFEVSPEFQKQLQRIYQAYLPVKDALIASDAPTAKAKAKTLLSEINKVDMTLVKGEAHTTWMNDLAVLKVTSDELSKEVDIKASRLLLSPLSDQLYHTLKKFNVITGGFRQFCPMAMNNKGAFWLSDSEEVLNPYFGEAMLTCGNVEEELK